ncbi:uncharacterized protein L969DRAFT_48031 [Mixia osmundae IAM 14324]|uniref:Mitochondrial Rho GTPase n=1 Tax=Mixia osmundae (strain CBS 9802 / IAM 14324 / JCM 22182 / KY 12970) TaxID=764103 RepID=G7EA11_MIXOS|nr:uncharacterized protein L969DRAFT_48031 [Mixia osmundae IAM 14324]KEI40358.1 hypothetical protein L969DRAFT_48031 [Mixia osmundae IAM 14324]GAA99671.1 hypothetical protein E5Q_06374 [Mixia osmundae IAM 14324]
MTRDIRIVLVGEQGVGKSTLITSLLKETFVQLPAHSLLPEVTIPPDVTPDANATTSIVDTSPRTEDSQHLHNEIRKAHVVAIVYSVDDPGTFEMVSLRWLPLIRQLGVNVPVILVGNKIDLRGGEVTNQGLEEEIMPIMTEYKEVETAVEASARLPLNVSEVFYFAQKAVLNPTAPLYDSRDHLLKPACIAALKRIFALCDTNKDGILSNQELNEFQRRCFNIALQQRELDGIKEIVRSHNPDFIQQDGITVEGFLYLHTSFIQKGRLETTWTVLRKFGYGDDVTLTEQFLSPRFDVPADCSVELSPRGYAFFTDIFEAFDRDQDGALRPEELDSLFSTSPGNPWTRQGFPLTTVTSTAGAVTLQGWLAQWSMTTLLEPKITLQYLAYLGYSNSSEEASIPITSALHITKPRKPELRKGTVSRSVFLAYVLGAAGSGKTSLLSALVNKPFTRQHNPTRKVATVVNSVESRGAERYLVLQEFGSNYESEILRSSKKLNLADVLVFVYDSSDTNSFSYVSNLRQQYRLDHIPSIFVATKSDLDLAQQRHEVQPDVYCRRLSLRVPVAVSFKYGQAAEVFQQIVNTAIHPLSSIPGGYDRSASRLSMILSVSALVGGITAASFMLYRRGLGALFSTWWTVKRESP